MNLVVGATGILGSEICRQLIADGRIPIQAIIAAIEADDDELIEGA